MNLNLACIGNCSFSALLDEKAQIVWSCFPSFHGDPLFCSLLMRSNTGSNDIGFFDINMSHFASSSQSYLRNSAVVSTQLVDKFGSVLEITDFVPRFPMAEREFRPNMLIRVLKPLKGIPRAQVRLRPTFGYGWGVPEKTRGSNHIRYLLSNMTLRLTTNIPVSYIIDEAVFDIDDTYYLCLMPDESLKQPLTEMCDSFLSKTLYYWRDWCRKLAIPFEWQDQVLQSAITLKLNNFEETGAFVDAVTTSIPSGPDGHGVFDHRYCWIRDSYYVVQTLNLMGESRTMEAYLSYLSNLVAMFYESGEERKRRIQPVYGIALETRLYEKEMHRLPGYRSMGPVKLGTKDAQLYQHDVYGAVILALCQLFFDRRIVRKAGDDPAALFKRLEGLGEQALVEYDQPDYGPGTHSAQPQVHTYSGVMCWVACDRLAKIAAKLGLSERQQVWQAAATKIHQAVDAVAWSAELNSYVSTANGSDVDAFLLRLARLGFVEASSPRFQSTLSYVASKLQHDKYLKCFSADSTCNFAATFWYVEALADAGKEEEARALYNHLLSLLRHGGLLSATIDPSTHELWGNFPQLSSMTGLILCAFRLSSSWKHAF